MPDGWTRSPDPGVNRTGTPISHPTGECRSRNKPAGHSKDNRDGVSRFASQTSSGNKPTVRTGPRVTALTTRSAHPNTSSLPVIGRSNRACLHGLIARYGRPSSIDTSQNIPGSRAVSGPIERSGGHHPSSRRPQGRKSSSASTEADSLPDGPWLFALECGRGHIPSP